MLEKIYYEIIFNNSKNDFNNFISCMLKKIFKNNNDISYDVQYSKQVGYESCDVCFLINKNIVNISFLKTNNKKILAVPTKRQKQENANSFLSSIIDNIKTLYKCKITKNSL